ncbi:hypothetical protein AX16_006922 [Volvariella volvacea WC 439]|nr:hypothetical protein AX16_006922 [Volvariella volvacea WC 439]
METRALLQANCERLLEQYVTNLDDILTLQATLIRDILPSVADELGLGPEAVEWGKDWLSDTASIFRIARRNNFTRSFALEAIRKTLVWRIENLWSLGPSPVVPLIHCLPNDARDPYGRPILVIEMGGSMTEDPTAAKALIIQVVERLRAHLQLLNAEAELNHSSPTLQYFILLDLRNLSIQSLDIDLITWTIREVIPRFPGMLAGVMMVNYSWAYSGLWAVVKRLLPSSALSRVFSPTQQELIQYFSEGVLPKDYGGSLPYLSQLKDPLQKEQQESSLSSDVSPSCPATSEPLTTPLAAVTSIPSTSVLNPYFGYPASLSGGSSSLLYGRRRKRDLIRTLITLFWRRWRAQLSVGFIIALLALVITWCKRRGLVLHRKFITWRALKLVGFQPH